LVWRLCLSIYLLLNRLKDMNKNTIYDGKIYVIGITGSIASGKSLVGSQLKSLGIAVIDLDHLTHELLNNQGPVYDRVIARFGQDIAPTQGAPIDRKKLGGIVFGDGKARKDLEAILHPAIRDLRDKKINDLARQGNGIVAILVPLLFETNTQDQYNEVWMVTAHEDIQLVRLVHRDKLSEADARKRIEAQWPQDKKVQLADRIINNSASPNLTLERVKTVLNEAQLEAQKPRVRISAPSPASSPAPTPTSTPVKTDTGAAANVDVDDSINPTAPATADSTSLPTATTVTEDGTLEADLTGPQITGPAAEATTSPVPATIETPAEDEDDANAVASDADLTGPQVTGPAAEATTSPVPATIETPAEDEDDANAVASDADLTGPQVTGPTAEATTSPVPPLTEPANSPSSNTHPHRRYSQQTILLAFFSLLAFLATLVALTIAGNTGTAPAGKATTSTATPPVQAIKANTGEAIIKLIEGGGDLFKFKCIPPDTRCQNQIHSIKQSTTVSSLCGEVTTSEEAPAFALRYLHNEVRWQVALWNLSNDHISCQTTVLEGRNRDGNLIVRQLYGKTLAFQEQYTVAYMVGAIRIDRFNSYNRFDGRTVYHFNDKGRLIEATLLNSQQRPVNAIFVEYRDGTTSISKEASYTTDGALSNSKVFETTTEAQDFINNTFYLPELISDN
jgi:dephospho-CoA kinase